MRYTLVGVATLGFDLTRLPHGAAVAEVLRRALSAEPEDLDRFAAAHPGVRERLQQRAELRAAVAAPDSLAEVLPHAGRAVAEAARGQVDTLRRLESAMIGDAAGLDHLIHQEALDWTWLRSGSMAVQDPVAADAADVLADAAVAHYHRGSAPTGPWRELAAPLLAASPAERAGEPLPPAIAEVLDAVSGADDALRTTWRRVVDDLRPHTAQWAPAMHQASWAVTTADRLRLAAEVQLAGVVAFQAGGFTATDAAYGAWNSLAGVLQAHVVADLLPAAEAEVLLRPWRRVVG